MPAARSLPLCLTAALLGLALVLVACGDQLSVKYGADGEACFIDNDCDDELVCIRQTCQLPADNFQLSCQGVCTYIEECGLTEASCLAECESETEGWSASGRQQAFACLLDLSCAELTQNVATEECKSLAR